MIQDFSAALEAAGFAVSANRKRANCPQPDCSGKSSWTVAIYSDDAFCFRCRKHWDAKTLEREFNTTIPPPSPELTAARSRVELFTAWLETVEKLLRDELYRLGRAAENAKWILAEVEKPHCQACQEFFKAHPEAVSDEWDALADFYHNRATLEAALEFITFEPVPHWLEEPMTAEKLFQEFEKAVIRAKVR